MQPVAEIVDGVSSHIFEDQLLIFSEGQQKLFSLNASAAYIWSCCENRMGFEEVVSTLMETYGIALDQARADVTQALAEWAAVGLMHRGSPEQDGLAAEPAPAVESTEPGDAVEAVLRDSRDGFRLRLAGSEFIIPLAPAEVARPLAEIFSHLASHSSGPAYVIEIGESGGLCWIRAPLIPLVEGIALEHLIPVATQLVLQSAYRNCDFLMAVHGAVLSRGNECVILPGQSGNGKTTLSAALIKHGFTYFTDEIALLDRASLHVIPVPVSLRVKESGWGIVSGMFPHLDRQPWHLLQDGQRLRYLPPPPGSFAQDPEGRSPARWIVFPRYAPDTRTSMTPISRIEAISRLQSAGYDIGGVFDRTKIVEILAWLKTVDCYEMTVNGLEEAVTLLRSLMA